MRKVELGLGELVARHVDLGEAPGRANAGDKLLTLLAVAAGAGDVLMARLRQGRANTALGAPPTSCGKP